MLVLAEDNAWGHMVVPADRGTLQVFSKPCVGAEVAGAVIPTGCTIVRYMPSSVGVQPTSTWCEEDKRPPPGVCWALVYARLDPTDSSKRTEGWVQVARGSDALCTDLANRALQPYPFQYCSGAFASVSEGAGGVVWAGPAWALHQP
jgi:hypothetical protein